MDLKKLERANFLAKEIETLYVALEQLYNMKKDNDKRNNYFNLHISTHSDGSGNPINLNRNNGNEELLDTIENALENQLRALKDEFESL